MELKRYGLAPALLASLGSREAITLNYDELFETASDDAGVPRSVIPDGAGEHDDWLLKLHGSVTDPDSIVLTRD
ncbi:SIR2 family protein, partial [Priestia sp. SIMBA_032]|uniref:SIR2 family protein n=1 Tax=Priestia sp. SIMBA_032 TaxID=3085775 RepID=UPI00397C91F9